MTNNSLLGAKKTKDPIKLKITQEYVSFRHCQVTNSPCFHDGVISCSHVECSSCFSLIIINKLEPFPYLYLNFDFFF